MKLLTPRFLLLVLLLSCHQFAFPSKCAANQIDNLGKFIKSQNSENPPHAEAWPELDVAVDTLSPVVIGPQTGLMEADKIDSLPGQPEGVNFDQYSGYVTVDPQVGRALFYYFVESTWNSSGKPLVLWLNGGPGCSSFGYGAMEELGPFRVHSDGKRLYRNEYSWNEVANVIFLESPAGVGFSYSNRTSDYTHAGDKFTAEDSCIFLVNWLERFPQYKNRDFYITGESYAGHYVPQLSYLILAMNKRHKEIFINLKGIAIGNAYIDADLNLKGTYDFFWSHALNSDELHRRIIKYCEHSTKNSSAACEDSVVQVYVQAGGIDVYNIYAPMCRLSRQPSNSVKEFDPCSDHYVLSYLDRVEVKQALHVHPLNYSWDFCSGIALGWNDSPKTILPMIKQLIATGIRIWIYSGDIDGRVPVTDSRYCINSLKLPIETSWRAWYSDEEVGGYVVGYKGLVLVTVRGAGHEVPSYQPGRALTMISSFLQGNLPPRE